jgi:hypothetical protein
VLICTDGNYPFCLRVCKPTFLTFDSSFAAPMRSGSARDVPSRPSLGSASRSSRSGGAAAPVIACRAPTRVADGPSATRQRWPWCAPAFLRTPMRRWPR